MRKLIRELSLFGMLVSARWEIFKTCHLPRLLSAERKALLAGAVFGVLLILLVELS